VERFDGNVGSVNAALKQTPEVFQPVGMDLAVNSSAVTQNRPMVVT
jgi:hypothetical protein